MAHNDTFLLAQEKFAWVRPGYDRARGQEFAASDLRKCGNVPTNEYAVGTAAGAGLAGVLYAMVTGGFGDKLLKTLFDHVLSLLGIG